jgi:hypothetical protein
MEQNTIIQLTANGFGEKAIFYTAGVLSAD